MIEIEQAVESAKNGFNNLMPEASKYREVGLEEFELSDDQKYWNVTLGYSEPLPDLEPAGTGHGPYLKLLGGPRFNRRYKVFRIDAETGDVRAMKDRTP